MSLQIFYAMNARKAKLIRVHTRQISVSQAKIFPSRAQRAFFSEASRRRIGRRRESNCFPQGAKPAREVEVFKNRDIAIPAEAIKDVAPDENGLIAEMPAPEATPDTGKAAGHCENQ